MVEEDIVTSNLLPDSDRKSGAVKLQIVPSQPKTLSHLPNRPAVDLAFENLTYRVKEGRKSSKCHFPSLPHNYAFNEIKKKPQKELNKN